ncbi:MAG: hypothetical protein OXL96_20660 [Candidatus Poribacteria bacterium]|nr:hypothetical protein [Candidatus Poribacteria bacterium]
MKQKFFAIGGIAVLAIVGVFIFQYATLAQRPDRNAQNQQRGNRQGGERANRGGMSINFVSIIENSWIDLTFSVKADDETLVKARPVYQEAHEKIAAKMKEILGSDDMRAAMRENQSYIVDTGKAFNANLKEILTEEQFTKLEQLRKKREAERQQRMNRFRGGERGRGGGGGGGGR